MDPYQSRTGLCGPSQSHSKKHVLEGINFMSLLRDFDVCNKQGLLTFSYIMFAMFSDHGCRAHK